MGRKITKLGWFTVPEWEREQEWLRKQHKKGWKLINATIPCFYRFEECTPEDVVYQLDYNQEGLDNRGDYFQMFHDCGWEYVTEMAGYSYFRKPVSAMNNDEEENIFSDDASKMDMIHRVFNGRVRVLLVIFFCTIIPQLFMQFNNHSEAGMVLFWVLAIFFVMYITAFIKFAVVYWKVKKRMEK